METSPAHCGENLGAGQRFGQLVVKGLDAVINVAVLILFLFFLLYGSFVLLQTGDVYHAASVEEYVMYKPLPEDDGEAFAALRELNGDVFAWLTVYGANIDYPLAHTDNNEMYVNTDIYGEYSISGSLFLDFRNAPDFSDFNSIIYGHHMDKNVMFGGLENFIDPVYLDEHKYGNLFYGGRDYGIEFFAFLEADAYDGTIYRVGVPQGQEEDYVRNLLEKSVHTRGIDVTQQDHIVLLSTCTSNSTNGRHILVGKVTDETFADTFQPGNSGVTPSRGSTSLEDATLLGMPLWMLLPPCVLLILIVIYFLCRGARKEKYEPKYKK